MNHEKYLELNTLSLYNELTSEEQQELVEHLAQCSSCLIDLAEKNRTKTLLIDDNSTPIASDKLLNDARRELRKALSNVDNKKLFSKIKDGFLNFFSANYKFALTAAVAVVIGVFIGARLNKPTVNNTSSVQVINAGYKAENALKNGAGILNVEFINNNPESGEVEFTFDAVKKMHVKGNANSADIQRILTYAMLNGQNSGIKLNSLSLINNQSDIKADNDIKAAAINLIKNDPNPGVRTEALKLIKKVPYDDDVKKALLYVLTNDKNSGIRIEAINIIVNSRKEGSSISTEDINMFKNKLQSDESKYMQYKFKTVLQENI